MAHKATEISPAQLAKYAPVARARVHARRERLEARRTRAWEVARRAAALLKEQCGVKRVALFGSLTRPALFYERSDVDLAVWGLDERLYLKVVGQLLALDPEIRVDLVEAEFARPTLQATIEREGMPL